LLLKVITGEPRFSHLSIYDAIRAALENRQIIKPPSVNDALWRLVEKCWQVKPELRPTISDLVRDLVSQLDGECSEAKSYEWEKGIMPFHSSLLALHLAPSPTLLPGDQTLTITNEDTIVA